MPALTRADVPDALYPTDNDYGIPLLDLKMQALSIKAPVIVWGSINGGRKRQHQGTWLFYTEDYRFAALWHDPTPVLNSGCTNVVEANFSLYNDMPVAVALYRIYQKRWLARFWQSQGIRVFVDLNVAEPFVGFNFMGVPYGWQAYCTRGYNFRGDALDREFARATVHAGTQDILFFVYGGGREIQQQCWERGWLWLMEDRTAARKWSSERQMHGLPGVCPTPHGLPGRLTAPDAYPLGALPAPLLTAGDDIYEDEEEASMPEEDDG